MDRRAAHVSSLFTGSVHGVEVKVEGPAWLFSLELGLEGDGSRPA